MKKSDSLLFALSKAAIIILFVYYFVVLLTCLIGAIYVMCNLPIEVDKKTVIIKTIISSFSASGMLCCLQYIKRLYKACITDRIVESSYKFEQLGNIIYFILRPFYSFAFVTVMIFAVLSGMFVITGNLDYIINEKFLYLSVILSSYIGYSVGQVLDKFEKTSKEKIGNKNEEKLC